MPVNSKSEQKKCPCKNETVLQINCYFN